ncbi:hypothetical protein B0H66DRAFT_380199 [Apodospora peruviana]|uniref:NodB homology domain-containing protein n=1 Tax=Apodospora peruviana TaxID=516989 RepID=A0AAE0HTS9_9PEZI|nr:hypothetical protein B0H66DRAFT_380199 [Apodospora peruviana]
MTLPFKWPNGFKACISFTMDNLGEAQDVNKGTWHDPIGTHFSITNQLPRMLDMLEHTVPNRPIKATYFAESWSLDVYPEMVNEIRCRGHEVAWHGYQHEVWSSLSEEEEAANFDKSFTKAAQHGIEYEGFRPPGGTVNEQTYGLLKQRGVKYISPLGKFGFGEEGIVVLPFEWRAVDAFYYMDKFGGIREHYGERKEVLEPKDFEACLMKKIDETLEEGGYMSILFHPFLQLSEEKFAVMERVLKRIGGDEDIWCAPCNEVARWVLEQQEKQ